MAKTRTKTIGIVGGGQLGRMLTLAAKPLGFEVIVLEAKADCPAAQVGARQIVGDLYDAKALRQLAKQADYLTIEIEHLNVGALHKLAQSGLPVNPSPATVAMIQDKFAQKEFLQQANIPVAESLAIDSPEQAASVLRQFAGKMLLKTRHGAYDGRGNALVTSPAQLKSALKRFKGQDLYAERYVPFTKELAVMVVRSTDGQIKTYPVVETIHRRNICDQVIVPADISPTTRQRADRLAKQVAERLQGAGVFGIEMFLLVNGQILVNEIAPRVHNSGHYTTEVCHTSQFEQHVRAIAGLPLGSTKMKVPAAVMINILGERDGPTELKGLDKALAIEGVNLHWYGKSPTKIDRKMGHITAVAGNIKTARAHAQRARKLIQI
jgi:phosphoribosylaminoimidazole carboxylase PurK protein